MIKSEVPSTVDCDILRASNERRLPDFMHVNLTLQLFCVSSCWIIGFAQWKRRQRSDDSFSWTEKSPHLRSCWGEKFGHGDGSLWRVPFFFVFPWRSFAWWLYNIVYFLNSPNILVQDRMFDVSTLAPHSFNSAWKSRIAILLIGCELETFFS